MAGCWVWNNHYWISNWGWYIDESTKLSQCHSLGGISSGERNLTCLTSITFRGLSGCRTLSKLKPYFLGEQSIPAFPILDQVSLLCAARQSHGYPYLKHLWQCFLMTWLHVCLPHLAVGAICFRTRSIPSPLYSMWLAECGYWVGNHKGSLKDIKDEWMNECSSRKIVS